MECIFYKKGYKYQLTATYSVKIKIKPETAIKSSSGYVELDAEGNLTITQGYAWDGPSGPTFDTRNFMRGSLIHDALYQLMREKLLDKDTHREPADRLLQSMCREDGMSKLRAWWVYKGLRIGGDPAADPENIRPVISAPKGCGNQVK
ncbi:MAG: DUF1353 domain-containing protein [Calditrichaeota bacterium]|nr:MAG: DUF1353 domain-containing protein [Calditrichota bacterium]